jgi:antirestriction protein
MHEHPTNPDEPSHEQENAPETPAPTAAERSPDQPRQASDAPDSGHDPDEAATPEQPTNEHPQIWIGSLSDYNNGILHGEWIDAAREPADIWTDIHRMLASSPTMAETGDPAEEWGIFDHEHFGPLRIDQHESITYVAAVAQGIAEHGPAFAAWADVMEDEELLDGFSDAFLGHYDSVEAYIEQWLDDTGYQRMLDEALPEPVRRYAEFNSAGLAQDLWLSGDIHVVTAESGGVYLFEADH